jgi:phage replication-related protein YjqB (UPF0714/DUF867 family)
MKKNRDKYFNFEALRKGERAGIDYEIVALRRPDAKAIVIAPHGGAIEAHTSEIARKIAGDCFSYYAFEGKKPSNNRDLHITSHRFDEPCGVSLIQAHRWVVAIHGCKGDEPRALLGGRDKNLVAYIAAGLLARRVSCATEGHDFPGMALTNICNRSSSGAGVQIELTMSFRNGAGVKDLVAVVGKALADRITGHNSAL